jgi:hypothetical protein
MANSKDLKQHPDEAAIPCLALRPRSAARALDMSERKLWEITADLTSRVPHVRLGKMILYPVDDLRRWLSERAMSRARGGS